MKRSVSSLWTFLAVVLLAVAARAGDDAPKIFWASDPVRPGETVVLERLNLTSNDVAKLRQVKHRRGYKDRAPQIFWASDPVRPGETVVFEGMGFTTNDVVEIMQVGHRRVAYADILQCTDYSLKFLIPAAWDMSTVLCQVKTRESLARQVLLNVPEAWWIQCDEGQTASPRGWVRIFGKGLNFGLQSEVTMMTYQEGFAMEAVTGDCYALKFAVPDDFEGEYELIVRNGTDFVNDSKEIGTIRVVKSTPWPTNVFSVVESMGTDAEKEMRKSLVKYREVKDCTAGILAALKKAKDNGGGVVWFPAGRYGITNEIAVPPKTVLRGEGEGLVVLWWGSGRFNLDGGSDLGYARKEGEAKPPANLVSGRDFTIENMSLYAPPDYQTVIDAQENVRIRHVRMRIDHYWTLHTQRYDGWFARLGKNCEVTDCDIQAKGGGISPGTYCWIARNKITAGKVPCPLGGARQVIVEDNEFISTHPTAYQNIAGHGKNIYYARNTHTALNTHQADFSFTFDTGMSAFCGKLAEASGTNLVLAADPVFPTWAKENSSYWKEAVVCILDGKGAGQYRDVTLNRGRAWTIDRPFDVAPDASSTVTIVPFNGRILVVGNRFEDANWVNAGFGTSIDVIYANNKLVRCAQLLNHGLETKGFIQPSWYVQYLDNEMSEGQTSLDITGDMRGKDLYDGPITRCVIARRNSFASDNGGSISVADNVSDVLVEGSVFRRPESFIRANGCASGLVFRNNRFEAGAPRYEGNQISNAVVLPAPAAAAK